MKNIKRFAIAMAAITLAVIVVVEISQRLPKVDAASQQTDRPGFGMVGITNGQTVRISVVNTSNPPDPDFPPDPIRVTLTFRDASGNLVRNADGNVVRRVEQLQGGASATLDLNADQFARVPETNGRLQVRPVVQIQLTAPVGGTQFPPDPIIPAIEVLNNATGRTQFYISPLPAVQGAVLAN